IRDLLKGGVQSRQLQTELEAFSKTLMLLEEAPANRRIDVSLLFEFLCGQYPQRKTELETVQEKYIRDEFADRQSLFRILLDLLDEKTDRAVDFSVADNKAINFQLLRLLDNAEIPDSFADQANQLKARLQADAPVQLGAVLEETVALLLAIKKQQALEQLEMADFLSKLMEQLAELGLKATGVDIATENAINKRNLLDETVSQQMAELQNRSASATQLEPLKQLVHTQLSSISQQIQAHNQQERIEREAARCELKSLAQRVREMEAESAELKSKLDIAQYKATRDPLTRLPNRLAFEDRLADEVARWKRHSLPLSMVMWDIDLFKRINDNYGHKSGDKALVAIAQLLSGNCRETDFVARFGGEEFVMLLPNTDARTALSVADKVRKTVENANFNVAGDRVTITLSCGISQLVAGDNNESVFERADKALYRAKQNGRNQCVVI
ncbi:MAG: diguanylate cyclase, partial [Methylococcaceae bacterium]|nr:diguanylate cyclase [Methylococcaceae bacterium]